MVRQPTLAIIVALSLGGCSAGAPTVFLAGAYFPAWLLCAVAGVVGAVIVRIGLVAAGIDDTIPFRLPVYICIAIVIGLLVAFAGFSR